MPDISSAFLWDLTEIEHKDLGLKSEGESMEVQELCIKIKALPKTNSEIDNDN